MKLPDICPADSICFQTTPVDELNRLAAQIDPRLYFAVYYQPKSWIEDESPRYNFRTMATNLYGLFHDCGNFIRVISVHVMPGVVDYLNTVTSFTTLSDEDKEVLCQSDINKRYSGWMAVVEAWRSVFCHNNNDQQSLNLDATGTVLNWCDSEVPFLSMNVSMTAFDSIAGEDWALLMKKMVRETHEVQWCLEKCLLTVASMPEGTFIKQKIVKCWMDDLVHWYMTKQDLLLNWIADWYGYYINTKAKGIDAGVYDEEKSFRKNAQLWAKNEFGDPSRRIRQWAEPWLKRDEMRSLLFGDSCPKPAFPDDVFIELAQNVHKDVRVWAVNHRLH